MVMMVFCLIVFVCVNDMVDDRLNDVLCVVCVVIILENDGMVIVMRMVSMVSVIISFVSVKF